MKVKSIPINLISVSSKLRLIHPWNFCPSFNAIRSNQSKNQSIKSLVVKLAALFDYC